MSPAAAELFRATLFHTPHNPFSLPLGDVETLTCVSDGGLLVSGGRIAACGDFADLRRSYPDIRVHDWRGGCIIPGLVDAHVHFPQVRIIGALGRTLLDWLEHVALPEEARMADATYAASTAQLFVHGLASAGTTTALVFGAHYAGATAELFIAAGKSGLRLATGLVMSDRLLLPGLHQSPADAHRHSQALIARYHGKGRLRYAVTPRFAYSASEAMLEVCQQLMREHEGVLFQTHLNENSIEVDRILELFPWAGDYLSVYERYELTGPRSIFAHSVHSRAAEVARMAASRSAVAHCPGSNASLGSGIFPMRQHIDAGVACALGTDVGGGIGLSIMREALQAYLTQRLSPTPLPLDAARLLYLATAAGAQALGLQHEIGDFTTGKAADFVYLCPPDGSIIEAAVRRADNPSQMLAVLFTMAGPECVREVRIEGDVVYAQRDIS